MQKCHRLRIWAERLQLVAMLCRQLLAAVGKPMHLPGTIGRPVRMVAQTHGNINNIAGVNMQRLLGRYQLGRAMGQPADKVVGGTVVSGIVRVPRLVVLKLGEEKRIIEFLVIHLV